MKKRKKILEFCAKMFRKRLKIFRQRISLLKRNPAFGALGFSNPTTKVRKILKNKAVQRKLKRLKNRSRRNLKISLNLSLTFQQVSKQVLILKVQIRQDQKSKKKRLSNLKLIQNLCKSILARLKIHLRQKQPNPQKTQTMRFNLSRYLMLLETRNSRLTFSTSHSKIK